MNIVVFTIVCVVLVALAGLLAATEAALSVSSSGDIRELARSRKRSRSLDSIAREVRTHRNTTTFARIASETTVAVLVTGMLVASALPVWAALLVSILVMVGVSFVLAGSSPRSVGRAHPQRILIISAPIVHGFRVVLGPLANLLVALGDRVTPGRPASGAFTSEEQLLSMVDEAVRHDVPENDERELIHSIFEWNETLVREIMVPRIDMEVIDAQADLRQAAERFVATGYSRLPVIGADIDDVVGVLYLRDVARRSMLGQQDLDDISVTSIARPALFIPDTKKADDTLKDFQRASVHVALVVDEYGGIAGIVTLEDLIEELVGEIADEHDRTAPDVRELSPGRYSVSSRLNTEDLGDLFGLVLDDEDVDSVGGLMTKELERLPQLGDRVRVSGLVLEAEEQDASRGHVTRIVVWADDDLLAAREVFADRERDEDD